jgi:hypothetical protein
VTDADHLDNLSEKYSRCSRARVVALTLSEILDKLKQAGLSFEAGEIKVEQRVDCLAVHLPGDRLAWFPTNVETADRLRIEDRVLKLVEARCSFAAPRVLFGSDDGWTIRSMARGAVDPEGHAKLLQEDRGKIAKVASFLAAALAEQHTRIYKDDVAGWLPTELGWPSPRATIEAQLPLVIQDEALLARIDRVLNAYEASRSWNDRALVHSDIGLHNLALDPKSGDVNGIFDYRDAAWVDRHFEFRYFVFGKVPDVLLDAIIRQYAEHTGVKLSRERVLLCNAALAISHLAYRAGKGPDEVVGGRNLAQDLGWTNWAVRRAGF